MRSLEAVLVPILLVLSMAIVSTAPVTASAAAVASVPPASAPWVPIPNAEDFFFRQVANFSLLIRALVFREYLDLVHVVSGSVQAAGAGNNYSLLLRAADRTNGAVGRYQTVVWGVPGSRDWTWKVVSFQRVADKN
ncbi:hypothetical protein SEVIR_1G123100v4 [Setaria viridis]|uniref:Cystatin domain-containing protein n=3 Tax=Setaria TaxID=4554 RepID=A0A368PJJ4_SETIT|nr:hypothetical protein SETIT_1G124400v2 [Setaria italica]TKW38562.1 hypothetical protein SEVIR_1G123100v2 [Setaria viridis]